MSTQPASTRVAKYKGVAISKRRQRKEHADIAKIAAAEAANRAAERRDMIATAAYFLAQRRGFEPGHEVDDWLTAELQVAHAQAQQLS